MQYKTELLQDLDNFFATISEITAIKIVVTIAFALIFLGFKYSNFSIEEFKKNLGL